MVGVVGLGSEDPELKSHSAVELIPGGVYSACHPSEVGKGVPACWYPVPEWRPVQDCAQQPRRLLRQHQRFAQRMVPIDGWMEIHQQQRRQQNAPLGAVLKLKRDIYYYDYDTSIIIQT